MRSAEVVIVGAGVIGSSIAWHLASRGVRRIVVVDRAAAAGEGSTGRATGGFRVQFSTPVNVRLSLLSREKLIRFPDEIGVDPGYRTHGYLFLARSADALGALRDAQRVQQECGALDGKMISAEEAASMNPGVHDPAIIGGAFSATDGFIRPLEIMRGYAAAAQRSGVEFELGTNAVELRRVGPRVTAVRTSLGDIAAGAVVNAAGAWASNLSPVPITPLRRCVVPTEPTNALPESMPMTIWIDDGYHLRVRDGRVLLLWPDDPADPGEASVPPSWIDRVTSMTRERVPVLADVAIDRHSAWCGLYEMSPDRHAILGVSPDFDNLYLANGSSGHGAMHSPAIGQIIAEMITGRPTAVDVHALRPSRFAEGCAIASNHLL